MLSKNQIREIQSLHLKKFRELRALYIAEGVKTVTEVLLHHREILQAVFASADFIRNNFSLLEGLAAPLTEVSTDELKKISLQSSPNEVLAVCKAETDPEPVFDPLHQFSFYLDDIRDPGNMGTIIRLADWFGIPLIFCSPESCEFHNPKVIQASMGAFLRVRVVYTELGDLLARYRIKNVYGALLAGENIYTQKLGNGLVVIGNEANGIAERNMQHINRAITIPAAHSKGTESLNAAMAASIIAAEFYRQLKQ